MTTDEVFRGLLSVVPTYLQRDGHSICTTCGAVVGGASADQIRHTNCHTMLGRAAPARHPQRRRDPPD